MVLTTIVQKAKDHHMIQAERFPAVDLKDDIADTKTHPPSSSRLLHLLDHSPPLGGDNDNPEGLKTRLDA